MNVLWRRKQSFW